MSITSWRGRKEILTDNDIGLASLLLNNRHRIKVPEYNAHIRVRFGDAVSFGTISHQSTDTVVWMGCLEGVKHVSANKAGGASPRVEWKSVCYHRMASADQDKPHTRRFEP